MWLAACRVATSHREKTPITPLTIYYFLRSGFCEARCISEHVVRSVRMPPSQTTSIKNVHFTSIPIISIISSSHYFCIYIQNSTHAIYRNYIIGRKKQANNADNEATMMLAGRKRGGQQQGCGVYIHTRYRVLFLCLLSTLKYLLY